MDLKEKIKSLPSSLGVYLMKDSQDGIIYVGKSKNLKSSVGSYFRNSKSHSPKVLKLEKNLKDFDYILTDTEFEAFMPECKLILDETCREQYLKIIDKIIRLLNGTDKSILEKMESMMTCAAEKFDFENAAKYRELYRCSKLSDK